MSKQSFQILLLALLPTVASILYTIAEYVTERSHSFYTPDALIVTGIIAALTALPIFLSGFGRAWIHYVSYAVSALVAAYSTWHFFTCTGKLCDLLDIPIIVSMGIFAGLYTLGIFLRKWSEETLMVLLWAEGGILLLVMILGLF